MKRVSFFAIALLMMTACASNPHHGDVAATAATADRMPADYTEGKPKEGRDGLSYVAMGGNFYVLLANGNKCQITNKIKDFRMIPRGNYVLAYETHDGDLVMLRDGDARATQCYSQKDKKLEITTSQAPIKEWNIIGAKTGVSVTIVALDRDGRFRMYDESGNNLWSVAANRVDDYKLHPCHGKNGVPFNSKLLFVLADGKVYTGEPNGRVVVEQGTFRNMDDFIDAKKIKCN